MAAETWFGKDLNRFQFEPHSTPKCDRVLVECKGMFATVYDREFSISEVLDQPIPVTPFDC